MGSPTEQNPRTVFIPLGESHKLYSPNELAGLIQNLEVAPEGYLESISGPAPWVSDRNQGYPALGEPHGLFSCRLNDDTVDLLLLRAGSVMYRYAGWLEGWQQVHGGLVDERHPRFPDQFVVIDGKVIWCNGVDRARIFDYDGRSIPLGFEAPGPTPLIDGPDSPSADDSATLHANSSNYSWWGEIGDVSSLTDTKSGWLLPAQHTYRAQLEDEWGNRGPLSPHSAAANIRAQFFTPIPDDVTWVRGDGPGTNLDDLTRSHQVRVPAAQVPHAHKVNVYRTANRVQNDDTARFLCQHGGAAEFVLPDGKSDALLGMPAVEMAAMPVFRVMTAHDDQLVIANFHGDPGGMRWSEVQRPGSLPAANYCRPAVGGGEITAVFSHAGAVHVGSRGGLCAIPELGRPAITLAPGIGVEAPRSVQATADGLLLWLGRTGFYALPPASGSEMPRPKRISDPIHRLVREGLSPARMRMATSTLDPATGAYICSVPPAGRSRNWLQLIFDGSGWRRYDMSLGLADMTALRDFRGYVLGCGTDGTTNGVYALRREVQGYTPVARTAVFRSGWISADPEASTPFTVRKLYLRLLDADAANITIRTFADGSYVPLDTFSNALSIGRDTAADLMSPQSRNARSDVAGTAVIGTATLHPPRALWRWVATSSLVDVTSFAFEVRATYPTRMRLAAFSFDWSLQGSGDPRGRFPLHDDP